MPNYVSIRFTIAAEGDKLQNVLEAVRGENDVLGSFDFNRILPMPPSLNMEAGSKTMDSISARLCQLREGVKEDPAKVKAYKEALAAAGKSKRSGWSSIKYDMTMEEVQKIAERSKTTPEELFALGEQYLDNLQKYNASTWYDWCVDNWGTKWNLPEGKVQDDYALNLMTFETAWSAPLPVIQALSAKFPEISFMVEWADEDLGRNVGAQTYLGGVITNEFIPEDFSKEAYEFAFDIHDLEPRDCSMRYDAKTRTYVYDETLNEEPALSLDAKIAQLEKKTMEPSEQPDKDMER